MREPEIRHFLTHLAVDHNLAISTQNHALNARVFLDKAGSTVLWAISPKWCERRSRSAYRWC
jgi:hypothetical protein